MAASSRSVCRFLTMAFHPPMSSDLSARWSNRSPPLKPSGLGVGEPDCECMRLTGAARLSCIHGTVLDDWGLDTGACLGAPPPKAAEGEPLDFCARISATSARRVPFCASDATCGGGGLRRLVERVLRVPSSVVCALSIWTASRASRCAGMAVSLDSVFVLSFLLDFLPSGVACAWFAAASFRVSR